MKMHSQLLLPKWEEKKICFSADPEGRRLSSRGTTKAVVKRGRMPTVEDERIVSQPVV